MPDPTSSILVPDDPAATTAAIAVATDARPGCLPSFHEGPHGRRP